MSILDGNLSALSLESQLQTAQLSGGSIAGITVGAIGAAIVLLFVVVMYRRRGGDGVPRAALLEGGVSTPNLKKSKSGSSGSLRGSRVAVRRSQPKRIESQSPLEEFVRPSARTDRCGYALGSPDTQSPDLRRQSTDLLLI